MKTKPLISILLSVYNGEKYLDECLKSIIKQTYKNWELILINDGSNDETDHIIQKFLKDTRIKYFKQNNIGLTKSLNKAIKLSSGEFIARQDADDISEKNRLESQINLALQYPSCLITCNSFKINHNSEIIGYHNGPSNMNDILDSFLKFKNPLVHGSILIKKDYLKKNSYNEFYFASQDFELWIRLFKKINVKKVNQYLYLLRKHSENITYKNKRIFLKTIYMQALRFKLAIEIKRQYGNFPLGSLVDILKRVLIAVCRKK